LATWPTWGTGWRRAVAGSVAAKPFGHLRVRPFRDNLLDKPNAECMVSIDQYACLNQIEGIAQADDLGQPLSASIYERNTPAAVEDAEAGVLGSNTEIAPASQFHTACQAITMNSSYGRLEDIRDTGETHRTRLISTGASHQAFNVL